MIKRLTIFSFLFISLFLYAHISYAQQGKDSAVLKACEQITDELKQTTIERDSLKVQIELYKQLVATKDSQIENLNQQVVDWKEAAKIGNKIDTNNITAIQLLREEHSADLEEINRLRLENNKLRNSRDWRTIFGIGAGVLIGSQIGK